MSFHTRVTIFRERPALKLLGNELFAAGAIEDFYGAFIWTESIRPDEPEVLIINTKPWRRTYNKPKLVELFSDWQLYSVLTDTSGSGTMRKIEQLYVLIRPYIPT